MKMVKNALSIGSVFGIPIRVHISLPIVVILFSLFSGIGFLSILALAIGLFGSVALHELGHALVARAKGGYIHEIVLYPFGGAAKISNIPKRPIDEIGVALAGPGVSLVLALLLLQSRIELLWLVGYLNGMLFLFNILPIFPMDGGRVLRAVLTLKKGRVEATRVSATVGKYFCGLFVLVGLFGLPVKLFGLIGPFQHNFMLAFIGFYIYRAGQMEYRMVLTEQPSASFNAKPMEEIHMEVSPPPYSHPESRMESFKEKLRNLFRH